MVFQDPYASLNPRMTVGDILSEPLRFHGLTAHASRDPRARRGTARRRRPEPRKTAHATRMNSPAGSASASRLRARSPLEPDFIIADEPISSLDVNIQAQIINLLIDLQERFGLTYLFIAHDLAVVRHISDRIVVLYLGKVMEIAPAARPVLGAASSLHALSDFGGADPRCGGRSGARAPAAAGEPPSAIDPPSGCCFRTRCPIARPICAEVVPPLVAGTEPRHFAACHFPGSSRIRFRRAYRR